MLKRLFTLFVCLFIVFACDQDLGENIFILKGQVIGMEEGEFYIFLENGIDTISVDQGSFEFEGRLTGPSNVFFHIDPDDRSMEGGFPLFLEPARMELSFNSKIPFSPKLSGSKVHDQFLALEKKKATLKEKYALEQKALREANEKYRAAAKAGTSEEDLEAIKKEDSRAREKLDPYYDEIRQVDIDFIKKNPESFVGLFNSRFFIGQMKYKEGAALYALFSQELKDTPMGQEIANELAGLKAGSPGSMAKDISALDIKGEQFELSELRGKYVLIDFWASWCVPCREGNPHLLELYAKYKNKGFEILGVSDDDSRPEAWRKAVVKDEIGVWRHVLRGLKRVDREIVFENDISAGYGISTLPTKILIDPDGLIIGRYGSGGSEHYELDSKLEEIFGT